MRNKVKAITAASGLKRKAMINKRTKKAVKPARRARSRTKKPKFLSLRLQLSSEKTQQQQSTEIMSEIPSSATNHRQLNLFPLHPENTGEEKDMTTHDDHQNMAYFFSAADGGATTLTGLLDSSTNSSNSDEAKNATTTLSSTVSLSNTLSYAAYGEEGDIDDELLRTALRRNKERDDDDHDQSTEERWVFYSEVVERRRSDEEVTSSSPNVVTDDQTKLQKLALKLDYQNIMNAWSDRAPLYIHAHSNHHPQIVPDINNHQTYGVGGDCWGSNMGPGPEAGAGLWKVPEMKNNESSSNGDIGGGSEELKVAQREASVLRYKEKRQNRLFAKTIRYQVRKLNAEKRPRLKGRFVKRS